MAESDKLTDEIEAGIKRLINFNEESGSLRVEVVDDVPKSQKSLKKKGKDKYLHEKGIEASTQEVVEVLIDKSDSKKNSYKRRSDGDIFSDAPPRSNSKQNYGPPKLATTKVLEERTILKAKRKHRSNDSPEKKEINLSTPSSEVTVKDTSLTDDSQVKSKPDIKKKTHKQAVTNTSKPHHRQESPETEEKIVVQNQKEAIKKFLEIPEHKSKKKKKKKPKTGDEDDNADEKLQAQEREVIDKEIEQTDKEKTDQNIATESAAPVIQIVLHGKVITRKLISELERERIFPLKKKSNRFPRALFFCRLCEYHMDTEEDCERHVRDNRHSRRKEIFIIESKLSKLPPKTPDQISAIDEVIEQVYSEHTLSASDKTYRRQITEELENFLKKSIPDITLVLYGSSISGFGLKDSDVNIDLLVNGEQNQARALTLAFKVMKEAEQYKDVKSDFSAKVPCVYFSDKTGAVHCQLTISSTLAPKTANMLSIYSNMDPRVQKLGVTMRFFAKICKIDKQEEGTLPAYCFALMTVYYLQQCEPPVLPVLTKAACSQTAESPTKNRKPAVSTDLNIDKVKELAANWKSQNQESVGSLWIGLLKFYSLDFSNTSVVCIGQKDVLSRADKKWNTKRIAIEDPFSTKRNVARSVTNYEVFQYIWDCFRQSYFYFSVPTNYSELTPRQRNLLHKNKKSTKKEPQKEVIASCDEDEGKSSSESVIVLSEEEVEVTPSKGGSEPDQNVKDEELHSTAKSEVDGEDECETETPKENSEVLSQVKPENEQEFSNAKEENCSKCEGSESNEKPEQVEEVTCTDGTSVTEQNSDNSAEEVSKTLEKLVIDKCDSCHDNSQTVVNDIVDDLIMKGLASLSVKQKTPRKNDMELLPLVYDYIFSEKKFTDGKGPLVVCSICDKEGHLKSNCPDESLPDIEPLPKMNKKAMQLLTETIKQVPKDFGLSSKDYRERELIRQELEVFIQELYPNAELHLFGSSDNGFGFKQSDLDLCVTFVDKKTAEGLDLVAIIEDISKKLKTYKGLYNVFPITTAKVPIVKFKHRNSQLEGDISLYNLLALHNTRMISMYSKMDPRVKCLGYAIKVFAKVCDIGDASRGSLSSYAYILMLVYYLQQCKPPVLPVLQEMYPSKDKPERIIDGWNAWYYDQDVSQIFRTKNNQSVGELWLGLFTFYIEEFSVKDHVVCIRQHELLTRFEKLWNGKCIAIEDPFDLSHNLGAGLSRKMNQYIMKAFIHGRMLYGTPIVGKLPDKPSDYYFDNSLLTEGTPPNDRCCRVCNKIGHIARECPRLLMRKEREEKRKEENRMKEEMRKKDKDDKRRHKDQQYQQKGYRRADSENSNEREMQQRQRQYVEYNRSLSSPSSQQQKNQRGFYNVPQGIPIQNSNYPPQGYNGGKMQYQGMRSNSAQGRPPGFICNQPRPNLSPAKPPSHQYQQQQQQHPWMQQYIQPQRSSNMNIPPGSPIPPGLLGHSPNALYNADVYQPQGGGQRMGEVRPNYRQQQFRK